MGARAVPQQFSQGYGEPKMYRRHLPLSYWFVLFVILALSVIWSPAGLAQGSTGTIERLSVDSAGAQADNSSSLPAISSDGRYVTVLSLFSVGNTAYAGKFSGNGKTILRFASNTAAPGGWVPAEKVTWLAAGATFPSNLDGVEMAR